MRYLYSVPGSCVSDSSSHPALKPDTLANDSAVGWACKTVVLFVPGVPAMLLL
jgi:hypothetical protein